MSVNNDGLIITDLLLKGHWNHDTGQDDCQGECGKEPARHLDWHDLTAAQQQRFAEVASQDIMWQLTENFMPRDTLEEDEEFHGIALERCAPDETHDSDTTGEEADD